MNPKVSIIVPIYNSKKYLYKCINSLLNQTLKDIEIILIDDGSEDSSGSICDYFFKIDNRIKVIHKKNDGPSSSRNAGLDIAVGEFIGFVDSDDWVDLEMYQILTDSANQFEADIVACNITLVNLRGETILYNLKAANLLYTREEALRELYLNKILTFSSCNKIYKRELFHGVRYKEGIILEDMDLSYKIICKADKISYLSRPFYYYRYNESSILRKKFTLKRLDEYYVKKEMYDFYLKEYPEISDIVYLYVCSAGSYIFSLIKFHYRDKITEYRYLINYDNEILRRLCKRSDLGIKNKLKAWLFLFFPNSENNIRKFMYIKTRMILSGSKEN